MTGKQEILFSTALLSLKTPKRVRPHYLSWKAVSLMTDGKLKQKRFLLV